MASLGVYDRSVDWRFISISLFLIFIFYYPIYLWVVRIYKTQRIRSQLITTLYKPPLDMSPVDLSYIFSKKVDSRHLYATILHLTNRGVLHMSHKNGVTYTEIGPKLDDNLELYEKMLVGIVHSHKEAVPIDKIIEGNITYRLSSGSEIKGSKRYVFWWLLKQSLRDRGLIEKLMTSYYAKLVILFGAGGGLIVAFFPLFFWRLAQMNSDGKLDASRMNQTFMSAVSFWAISLPLILVISFILLLFRGRMLGRRWILTKKSLRYLGQFGVFREFTWLAQRKKLHFDSTTLAKESALETRPFAIAFGYIKKFRAYK